MPDKQGAPILTEDERTLLHGFLVAHPALVSDEQVFEALHAPTTIANPIAVAPQVRKPFAAVDLTAAIDPLRKTAIVPFLGDLAPLVASQDVAGIAAWGAELLALGILQQPDADAIAAVLAVTRPDPTWTTTVPGPSWAEVNLGALGAKTWNDAHGSLLNCIPIEAIAEAR